jgi:hypothetical protein
MRPHHIIEELENIYLHEPLFDGDSISSESLHACIKLNYARRDKDGNAVTTGHGKHIMEQLNDTCAYFMNR